VSDEPFSILDVSDWDIVSDETSGAEEKYWLQEPAGPLWLFKPVTVKQGHVHGEDWAEKVVSELGRLLGIPCARIELAEFRGQTGCISANLRPLTFELQPGQVLFEVCAVPGYEHGTGRRHPGTRWRTSGLYWTARSRRLAALFPSTRRPTTSSPVTFSWTRGWLTGTGTITTGQYCARS
jgi:hypothetical protein